MTCFLEINRSPSLVEIHHGLIPRKKKTMKKANNTKTGSILRILDHLDFILQKMGLSKPQLFRKKSKLLCVYP